jgi:3-hydroxyacyl-CoA dehydrogenase/3a,7a,12a-trihydroxy-5b-cholest-24-enoyl-CoA hydratase
MPFSGHACASTVLASDRQRSGALPSQAVFQPVPLVYGFDHLLHVKGSEQMRFDDNVVLITGASRGLGKAYARCIADAGALVAVNSTGRDNRGQQVVDEIAAAGGEAIHVPGNVEKSADLINAVVDACGQIDAVVHNAGFVQDKTLRKMSSEQWDAVLDVHLKSAFGLTQAAWPHFESRGGGRVVFLSSASGLYGNFGQANYAAAKAGMYGLCRTIAIEGAKSNIRCNCVAPFGATEMNSANMPEDFKATIKTEFVAPLIGYLAHPDCSETGSLFEASAGAYKKLRWERSKGLRLDTSKPLSIDDIAARWEEIVDFSVSEHPADMSESLRGMYDPTGSG